MVVQVSLLRNVSMIRNTLLSSHGAHGECDPKKIQRRSIVIGGGDTKQIQIAGIIRTDVLFLLLHCLV